MPDNIRVCQWGTFDAANYGDRLFPLIAKEELTARLPGLELTCYAPIGDATLPPGSPPLFPLVPDGGSLQRQRREYFARHFDSILIGGGDLLRFDRSEPGYGNSEHEGPPHPYDAFLDFLWAESEIEPNILWNAPGVPFPFEPSRWPLVRLARSHVRYAAVRDELSRGYLLEAGVEEPVHVSPDTGILLAELLRRRVDGEKARDLLERQGARLDGRGLLCFQCAPGFLRAEEEPVAKSLARIAARRNLKIVLLPIGLCHGDQDALEQVQRASGNRFTLVEDLESPLEIGAVIGACDYFVGSSLHGNLTALSFGIPHIVVNNPLRSAKLEGLVQLARLEEFRITGWEDLEDTFDRLADLILQAATERRMPDGMTHTATPRRAGTEKNIPLEVYGTIAELHEQLDYERASRHATEEELRNGLLIQRSVHREQLERYRARVEHLEARVGHFKTRGENLETEIEYLRTQLRKLKAQNKSLSGTLRDIKESRIWRLFGSYRRLRAKISALTRPKSENAKESAATRSD